MRTAPILLAFHSAILCLPGLLSARTITVTTERDEFDTPSGAQVSLREAIRDLGTGSGTICLAASVLQITLDRELILGSSAGLTVVDAAGFGEVPVKIVPGPSFGDANLISVANRRFQLKNAVLDRPASAARDSLTWAIDARGGADLRLENCHLTNWNADSRDAAAARCLLGSVVHVVNCELRANKTGLRAVAAPEALTVESSLFCFNRESAIQATINEGTSVLLRNTTFAENRGSTAVVAFDGAVGAGKLEVNHCSFVDNVGAAFQARPEAEVSYCLFARNNLPVGDGSSVSVVENAFFGVTSEGYNLVDDSPASFDDPTDMKGLAVKVSRLGDFGGAHYCCFPLAGSRAIDGGDPNRQTVLPVYDVRGFARKARAFGMGTFTNLVDIGAVETNPEGTLLVTQTGNFGSGSLRDAISMATGETAHIVVQTAITARVLAVNTPIVINADRNYTIDASLRSYEFAAADDEGPMLEITGNPGADVRPAVSLVGFNVKGFEADASSSRGCVRVVSADLALHRSNFEDNRTEEAGLVEVERGRLFLNECSFVANVQSADGAVVDYGGVALHLTATRATIWNSSFIGNATEARNGAVGFEGGAVRIEDPVPVVFRQCTLARNRAGGPGAAIFFGDYSATVGAGLILDRCTIVQNENTSGINAAKGAVSFGDRGSVEVAATLFAGNSNRGSDPSTKDLFGVNGAGRVSVSAPCPNWTDATQTIPGLVEAENLSTNLRFAPPAIWGDLIPTMPLLREFALTVDCGEIDRLYPRDAVNDIGFGGMLERPTAGAVQKTLDFGEALSVTLVNMTGGTATVRVRGRTGIVWSIEDSTTLGVFAPTGLTYTGGFLTTTINIPIPQPAPDDWFFRFRELVE